MDMSESRSLLPRALRPLAGWPDRGAVLRDVSWAIVIIALCLTEVSLRRTTEGPSGAESVAVVAAIVVLAALTVVLSRLYPLSALVVAMLCSFWLYGFGFVLLGVSYLVGRRMPRVRSAVVLFVVGAVLWLALAVLLWPDDLMALTTIVSTMLFSVVLPWLVGVYRRQHVALTTAGWEHARQLQRENRLTAEQVRLRERSRIAQDMHDSLGHELSLLALRAGALELDADLGEEHRRAAAELRTSAVTATRHLREIIGVLRTDAEPAPMSPAGEGVTALVDRARESGMRIALVHDGDTTDMPPMVDRAVHRVVQESLTNAAKYAPGADVTVWLTSSESRVEVRVTNSVPRGPLPGAGGGGRRGLIGLRERVRLTGGVFAAGPDGDGGWEVCATMPLDGTVEAAPEEDDDAQIDQLQSAARRRVRGWSLALVLVPAAALAALVLVVGWNGFQNMKESTLTPEEFAGLRVGDDQADVESVLPRHSLYVDARQLEEGAVPEGATCNYYRSDPAFFGTDVVLYQVCFAEGRLSTKGEAPLR